MLAEKLLKTRPSCTKNRNRIDARADPMPRLKGIGDSHQKRAQFWVVTHQHSFHAIVRDPTETERGVDLRGVIDGEEAIALDTPRRS